MEELEERAKKLREEYEKIEKRYREVTEKIEEIELGEVPSTDILMRKFGVHYQMRLMTEIGKKLTEKLEGLSGKHYEIGVTTLMSSASKKYSISDYYRDLRYRRLSPIEIDVVEELEKGKADIEKQIAKKIKKEKPAVMLYEALDAVNELIEMIKKK